MNLYRALEYTFKRELTKILKNTEFDTTLSLEIRKIIHCE